MKVLNLVLEDLTLERKTRELQLEVTLNDASINIEDKIKKLKKQLSSINDTNNNILLWSSYMDGLDKKSE
tara:strand:+ start:2289 stop:2498 length:210 start_codon:yes stop_codon:yes gene_type:complete